MSRISPWLLGVLFLGLAVGAMVMPLSSDIVPYAFLFDRAEAKKVAPRLTVALRGALWEHDIEHQSPQLLVLK